MRGVLDIPAYKEMIENIISGLQLGKTIFDTIQYESHLIYPNVAVMIKVGEETANLEDALSNIISMYQEELDTSNPYFYGSDGCFCSIRNFWSSILCNGKCRSLIFDDYNYENKKKKLIYLDRNHYCSYHYWSFDVNVTWVQSISTQIP